MLTRQVSSASHSSDAGVTFAEPNSCLCEQETPFWTLSIRESSCLFLGRNTTTFTVPLLMIALPLFSLTPVLSSSCDASHLHVSQVMGGLGALCSLILGAKASGVTFHTQLYSQNVQAPLLPVDAPPSSKCCHYRYLPPPSKTILKLYACALALNILSITIAQIICKEK